MWHSASRRCHSLRGRVTTRRREVFLLQWISHGHNLLDLKLTPLVLVRSRRHTTPVDLLYRDSYSRLRALPSTSPGIDGTEVVGCTRPYTADWTTLDERVGIRFTQFITTGKGVVSRHIHLLSLLSEPLWTFFTFPVPFKFQIHRPCPAPLLSFPPTKIRTDLSGSQVETLKSLYDVFKGCDLVPTKLVHSPSGPVRHEIVRSSVRPRVSSDSWWWICESVRFRVWQEERPEKVDLWSHKGFSDDRCIGYHWLFLFQY